MVVVFVGCAGCIQSYRLLRDGSKSNLRALFELDIWREMIQVQKAGGWVDGCTVTYTTRSSAAEVFQSRVVGPLRGETLSCASIAS